MFFGAHPKISDGWPLAAADIVPTLLQGLGRPGGGLDVDSRCAVSTHHPRVDTAAATGGLGG